MMAKLILNQALYGYNDGHQLLAASFNLGGAAATTALILSDVAGPATSIPADGYLTGYPLAQVGLYAVAVTWSAPEMPRPGCVWTHTIFIGFEDLAIFEDCSFLWNLFRRPLDRKNFRDFQQPIQCQQMGGGPSHLEALREDLSRVLLNALYSSPTKALVVRGMKDFPAESYALAVWGQQWPGLRRSFRFCTHSVGELSTPVGPFDLSMMPRAGASGSPPADSRMAFVDMETQALPKPPAWLELASRDLIRPGKFRRSLREYGADVSSGRSAFPVLSEVCAIEESNLPSADKMGRIGMLLDQNLPLQEAKIARRHVLREVVEAAETPTPEIRSFVIGHLDLLSSIEYGPFELKASRWLFQNCVPEAWSLLESPCGTTSIANRFVVEGLEAEVLTALESEPARTAAVVTVRPDLLTSSNFWKAHETIKRNALEYVCRSELLSNSVLSAMLRSGQNDIPRMLLWSNQADTLFAKLACLSDEDPPLISAEAWTAWFSAMMPDVNSLAAIIGGDTHITLSTLARLAKTLRPATVPNAPSGDPWVIAYENASGNLAAPDDLYLLCFLVSRAFSQVSSQAGKLLSIGLDTVYTAAEQSALSDVDWIMVRDTVRSPRWWLAWDRCDTLRFGVAALCHEGKLTPEEFLNCTKSDERFGRLLEEIADHWWGRRFLRGVAQQVPRSSSRRTVINHYL